MEQKDKPSGALLVVKNASDKRSSSQLNYTEGSDHSLKQSKGAHQRSNSALDEFDPILVRSPGQIFSSD